MTLSRFVPEGETFPRGYGMAWRSWERMGCVCYPIPLNWLAGWAYAAQIWLSHPTFMGGPAYQQGVAIGREMALKLTPDERAMRDRRTRSDDAELLESLLQRMR